MDYYRNVDHFRYLDSNPLKLKGISYKFIDESDYIEPVSVEEMKAYGYIDFATDDLILGSHILKSARQQAEQYIQKSLGVRTVEFKALECYDNYNLLWGPVASVSEETKYEVFGNILMEGGENITVVFTTDASLVNEDIKGAIMAQAYYIYQNRNRFKDEGSIVNLHDTFKEKLNPYRNITWP